MRYFITAALFFLSCTGFAKPPKYTPCIYHLHLPHFTRGEIAFINGMNHKPERAIRCAFKIAEVARKHNIYTIYNPTDGLFGDLKKCYHELYKFKLSVPVSKLHEKWDLFFASAPKHVKYLQFCHSQGTIQVRNALYRYPHELRKRIIVIAIAPAAYISDEICHHAYHYHSRRDIVPYFDLVGRKRCEDSIVILTPHEEAKVFDHHFLSPTFEPAIKHHIEEYMKENGMEL